MEIDKSSPQRIQKTGILLSTISMLFHHGYPYNYEFIDVSDRVNYE